MDDQSDYEPEFDELDDEHGTMRTKNGGYQLTNVLKLPRATTYSTQSLYGASEPLTSG